MSKAGFFGEYGGRFVPEQLEKALIEVEREFEKYKDDEDFLEELAYLNKQYTGRPNPLYYAENLSRSNGGAKIYLKREDLNHTGAHKINHALGQVLLAKRMGKKRIIAETGAGQHGVATATVCALCGIDCTVYQGAVDIERQKLNAFRMELLGAKLVPVTEGAATLKEAVDAALMDFAINSEDTYYLLGSVVGPHPYPTMVRTFQSVIGMETKKQILEAENRLPDYVMACVGGGSNAIGIFHPFFNDKDVKLIGVEPGGVDIETKGLHAATMTKGNPNIIHGFKCYTLSDKDGVPDPVHSVAAGLDYPGVGPEHCHYKDIGRAEYVHVSDQEAIDAFLTLSRKEGIIPAIESSHAIAHALKIAKDLPEDKIIVVNLSGRGDKDVAQVQELLKEDTSYMGYIDGIKEKI